MENKLYVGDDVLFEGNLAYRIRDESPNVLDVEGVKLPVRKSSDFPDVTGGHQVVARFFQNTIVPGRTSSDFPDVTDSHKAIADYMGKLSLEGSPTVVDMGCGTGFLGNYLGKNFNLRKLIFSDLSGDSIEHAKRTVNLNKNGFKTNRDNLEFRLGDAFQTLGDLDGGTAVCAPYLIPEVCTVFPGVYNLFGNVAKNQGLELYIGHSSLSQELINRSAENIGANLKEVYRVEDVKFHPEYGSENFPSQLIQRQERILLPETVESLRNLGLKGDENGYRHDLVVTRFSF